MVDIHEFMKKQNSYKYRIIESKIKNRKVRYTDGEILNEESMINNYFLILNKDSKDYCIDISGQGFDIDYCLRIIGLFQTNRNIGPKFVCEYKKYFENDCVKDYFSVAEYIIEYLKKHLKNKFNLSLEWWEIEQKLYGSEECFCQQHIMLDKYYYMDQTNIENCFLGTGISAESILCNVNQRLRFQMVDKKEKLKGNYIFSAFAMSKLINEVILQFYVSNIIKKASIFTLDNLGVRRFEKSFSMAIIPFSGIMFDSDGQICQKKYLIDKGRLVDVISNITYSNLVGCNSVGNADLLDRYSIIHQRIVLDIEQQYCSSLEIDGYVENIIITSAFAGVIEGKALVRSSNTIYCSEFCISIEHLFNTIECYYHNKEWNNNVKCPQCIISI